jgi:hypothetical protein
MPTVREGNDFTEDTGKSWNTGHERSVSTPMGTVRISAGGTAARMGNTKVGVGSSMMGPVKKEKPDYTKRVGG